MKTQILLSVILVSVLSLAPIFTGAIYTGSDATPSPDGVLTDNAIIVLKDQPLASYDGHVQGYARTMPTPGHKLDLSSAAAQSYSAYLANGRGLAKGWLKNNAPEVRVLDEYLVVPNAIAVQLYGHNMNHLLNAPGANWVFPNYLLHLDMNRSPTLIGAPVLWNAVGGQSNAGAGVKIGIIDTGIDQTHPFLTDNSLPALAGFPKCDAIDSAVGMADTQCNFVSNKVIVAKVFETRTNFDGHAAQEHGTHVSGIAAGVANTCAPFVSACNLSGIAPKAYLGNYNVFPGNVLDASSHDIAKAVEAAVADGMDVLNLSLGGTAKPNDVLVNTVNSAVDAGVVVAIAAGNAGPGPATIESPGIADKVITVGASTDPHFVGIPVTVPSLGTFGAALGQFNNFGTVNNSPYSTTTPTNGCTAITNNISGQIALIARGTCTFSTKIRNAQVAGATGVLVYNSVAGDPTAMAQDGTPNQPTISAAMVSRPNGLAMASASTKTVSIDGSTKQEFFTDGPSADILAGFSSVGPAMIKNQVLREVKPDVVAPGVNVYSSILMTSCAQPPCFAFFQGTSMATPHVAGSAALLKQLHPTWSPLQIKSALVNTAHRPVGSSSNNTPLPNPMDRGAGRIDLAAASQLTATISIGKFTSLGFGAVAAHSMKLTSQVSVTSVAPGSVTYTITVAPAVTGISVTTSLTSLTVSSSGTGAFKVLLTITPSTAAKDYYGDIVLSGGTVPLQVPYWIRVTP